MNNKLRMQSSQSSNVDKELAKKVVAIEDDVNVREVRLDELCVEVLACRQPAAGDLRMILSATNIIRDLEHIGDEAEKVAKMSLTLAKKGLHRVVMKKLGTWVS